MRRVVFVLYAADARAARTVARPLVRAFEEADVEVIDVLRADGDRWFPLLGRRRGVPLCGVAYDVSAHPFAAEAVLDGRVTHASREELADTLRADPDRVAAVAAALAARSARDPDGGTGGGRGRAGVGPATGGGPRRPAAPLPATPTSPGSWWACAISSCATPPGW